MHSNQQDTGSDFAKTIERDLAPYMETYNLHTLPFSATVPGNSCFMGADREQHLNHLIHLAQSSDMISVIVGKEGTGKTCLLQKFIERAPANLKCWYISADPEITAKNLLSTIAAKLNLPDNQDYQTLLESLRSQARSLKRNDLIPVILADDIENFSDGTLNALLSLQSNDAESEAAADSSWGIVLTTRPDYTAELMQFKLRMHFIQLAELSQDQTGQYILHRMKAAGLKEDLPFTPKDLEYIYKQTKGNIKKIQQLAHEMLLRGKGKYTLPAPEKKMRISPALKSRVWISAVLIIMLSSVLFFQNDINKLVNPEVSKSKKTVKESLKLPEPQGYLLKKIPDPAPVDVSSINSLHHPQKDTNQTQQPVVPPVKITTDKVITDDTTDLQPAKIKPAPAVIPVKVPEKIISTPALVTAPTKADDRLAAILKKHRIKGQEWILKQPPAFYTAQLMASSKPNLLIGHAKNPAFGGKTAIYHILRGKVNWYVLVYGSHQEKLSSRKSVINLPDTLHKNRPWIRTFESVQAEIEKGSK